MQVGTEELLQGSDCSLKGLVDFLKLLLLLPHRRVNTGVWIHANMSKYTESGFLPSIHGHRQAADRQTDGHTHRQTQALTLLQRHRNTIIYTEISISKNEIIQRCMHQYMDIYKHIYGELHRYSCIHTDYTQI